MDLRGGSLSNWWLDKLSDLMEEVYPDIIGHGELIDHWKRDGWNDGTTTLFGVYRVDGVYRRCSFPDYGEPASETVQPLIEHTGWAKGEKECVSRTSSL